MKLTIQERRKIDRERGKRILKFMRQAKLSRDECARRTGISQGIITKIRAGEDRPFSEMIALSRVMNVSLDAIAGLKNDAPGGESPMWRETWKRLPDVLRRDVIQLTTNIGK